MNVTLTRLTHRDINLLRELRNAEAKHFFSDQFITRPMQEAWWLKAQGDSRTQFYTVWLNGVIPVGFLSVRMAKFVSIGGQPEVMLRVREVGHILLAPTHRGRGIMAAALTEARRLYDPLTFWIAHVKRSNAASLKLFERQGFVAATKLRGKR